MIKTTRIIYHKQLMLTTYSTNDVKSAACCKLLSQWRQNDVKSAACRRLVNRSLSKPENEIVLRLVGGKKKSEMAKLL